ASIAAHRAIPGAAVYAATKAGVIAFSRALAEELRPNVRVGVLAPGAVDTPLWDAIPNGPDRARMLSADDVARCAVLMAALPSGAHLEDVTALPAGGILGYDRHRNAELHDTSCGDEGGRDGHADRDGREEGLRPSTRGRQAGVGPAHPGRGW